MAGSAARSMTAGRNTTEVVPYDGHLEIEVGAKVQSVAITALD
jgi:hypothetical protein